MQSQSQSTVKPATRQYVSVPDIMPPVTYCGFQLIDDFLLGMARRWPLPSHSFDMSFRRSLIANLRITDKR